MKMATGKVVGGKVVVEGEPLEEGSTVTVLAREGDETFELGPREEAELLKAIEEGERGDYVDGDDYLRSLSLRK